MAVSQYHTRYRDTAGGDRMLNAPTAKIHVVGQRSCNFNIKTCAKIFYVAVRRKNIFVCFVVVVVLPWLHRSSSGQLPWGIFLA